MKRRTCLAGTLALAARYAVPGGALALAGCGESEAREAMTRIAGPTMGTAYRVSLPRRLAADETSKTRSAVEAALQRVDALMSTYRPESELSCFNAAAAGEWTTMAADTASVISEAMRTSSISGGGFDVTVGPLVDLWGFGPGEQRGVPSDEAIADARALTGLDAFEFDPARGAVAKTRDGLRVDLCGVAKGHAVDLVAASLEASGFESYLVDVGGELKARGRKAGGSSWKVGIERPVPGRRELQRVVAMDGGAIATSGDYRNYFEREGRRYCHTIDPRSGRPVRHRLAGVSVVAERAATADALSTAMMVLGPDEGLALAERLGLPALFLLNEEQGIVERATESFRELVVT